MEKEIIKEKLQEYIDKGDDKLLKLMYAVAKEYSEEDEYEFTEEEIEELDKRKDMRLSGESKSYSWRDAKRIIIGEKQLDEL